MGQVNHGDLAESVIRKILHLWKTQKIIYDFVHATKGGQLDYAGIDFVVVLQEKGPQIFLQIKSSSRRHIKDSINEHRRLHPLVRLVFVLNKFPKDPLHDELFLIKVAAQLRGRINRFIFKEFKGRVPSI